MTKRFPGFIAIFAFFVVCVCGLLTDMSVEEICLRAVIGMSIFYLIGLGVGAVANRILLDSMFGDEPDSRIGESDADAVVKEKPGAQAATGESDN